MNFAKILISTVLLSPLPLYAAAQPTVSDPKAVRAVIQEILNDNAAYQKKFHELVSERSLKQQMPHTTAVLCSDSRVALTAINDQPEDNVFVIRNIGNQVQTAYRSVEYGVNVLNTHVLLVVGHSECGAVKTAMQDYSKVAPKIKQELDYMTVDPKASLNANIVHNVNHQVELAVTDFGDRITSGEVVVVGMVYDLHNDFKQGSGSLIVVNVNTEIDPVKLLDNEYLKNLNGLKVLKP